MNIEKEIDRCVMCGLCLPHCPTYGETLQEGDSPRGRLALIKAINAGTLANSAISDRHLDSCLQCGACEKMCPSGVSFLSIMDAARATHPVSTTGATAFLMRHVLLSARRVRVFSGFIRTTQRLGFHRIARLLSPAFVRRAIDTLPPITTRGTHNQRLQKKPDATPVQLFGGCITDAFDSESLAALIRILDELDYAPLIPKNQQCCGALHAHHGDTRTAAGLMAKNVSAFTSDASPPILSLATGCTAWLSEAAPFADRVNDACDFIANATGLSQLQFQPLNAIALIHTPCTRRNVLKETGSVTTLLGKIPELSVTELPVDNPCCGAAGTYFLEFPETADKLLNRQIEQIQAQQPRYLVTTNIGCSLHLQKGLRDAGLDVEVIHPITLLARQINHDQDYPEPQS